MLFLKSASKEEQKEETFVEELVKAFLTQNNLADQDRGSSVVSSIGNVAALCGALIDTSSLAGAVCCVYLFLSERLKDAAMEEVSNWFSGIMGIDMSKNAVENQSATLALASVKEMVGNLKMKWANREDTPAYKFVVNAVGLLTISGFVPAGTLTLQSAMGLTKKWASTVSGSSIIDMVSNVLEFSIEIISMTLSGVGLSSLVTARTPLTDGYRLISMGESFRNRMLEEEYGVTPDDYYCQVSAILRRVEAILKGKPSPSVSSMCTKMIVDLYKLKADLEKSFAESPMREKPYVMALVGPSGVGKSMMISFLITIAAKILDFKNELSVVAAHNPRTRHDDSQDGGTKVLVFDDAGAEKAERAVGETFPEHVIRAKSNAPSKLNKAEVDAKGRCADNSRFLIGTSNLVDCGASAMLEHPQAYFNRVVTVEVTAKPEYREPGGDRIRQDVMQTVHEMEVQQFRIVTLKQSTSSVSKKSGKTVNHGMLVTYSEYMDTKEFLRYIVQDMRKHRLHEKAVIKSLEKKDKVELCPLTDYLVSMCDCELCSTVADEDDESVEDKDEGDQHDDEEFVYDTGPFPKPPPRRPWVNAKTAACEFSVDDCMKTLGFLVSIPVWAPAMIVFHITRAITRTCLWMARRVLWFFYSPIFWFLSRKCDESYGDHLSWGERKIKEERAKREFCGDPPKPEFIPVERYQDAPEFKQLGFLQKWSLQEEEMAEIENQANLGDLLSQFASSTEIMAYWSSKCDQVDRWFTPTPQQTRILLPFWVVRETITFFLVWKRLSKLLTAVFICLYVWFIFLQFPCTSMVLGFIVFMYLSASFIFHGVTAIRTIIYVSGKRCFKKLGTSGVVDATVFGIALIGVVKLVRTGVGVFSSLQNESEIRNPDEEVTDGEAIAVCVRRLKRGELTEKQAIDQLVGNKLAASSMVNQGNLIPSSVSEVQQRLEEPDEWIKRAVEPLPRTPNTDTMTEEQFTALVRKHVCQLSGLAKAGETRSTIFAIHTHARELVTCNHFLKSIDCEAQLIARFSSDKDDGANKRGFIEMDTIVRSGDLVRFSMTGLNPNVPDIRRFICQDRKWSDDCPLHYVFKGVGDKQDRIVPVRGRPGKVSNEEGTFDGFSCKYSRQFTYKGDCGTPVVHLPSKSIVGFHAGVIKGVVCGMTSVLQLPREFMASRPLSFENQGGVSLVNSMDIGVEEMKLESYGSMLELEADVPARACTNFCYPAGPTGIAQQFHVHGSNVSYRVHGKSQVKITGFSKFLEEFGLANVHGPPRMQLNKDHSRIFHKVTAPREYLPWEALNWAMRQIIWNDKKCVFDKQYTRPLTKHETVNGIPGLVTKLNMKTACGVGLKGKKTEHFDEIVSPDGSVTYTPQEHVSEMWDLALERYSRSERLHPVAKTAAKDEPTPVTKTKTRLFFLMPLWNILVAKQCFAWMASMYKANPLVSEIWNGVKAQTDEWDQCMEYLEEYGGDDGYINGDFSGYDSSITCQIVEAVGRILVSTAYEREIPDVWLVIMMAWFTDILNPIVLWGGILLVLYGLNPSGNWLTTIINGFVNRILIRVFFYTGWTRYYGKPPKYQDFSDNVRMGFVGDDNIGAVKESIRSWFNMHEYQTFCAQYGYTYTAPDKDSHLPMFYRKEVVTLCKRSWLSDPGISSPSGNVGYWAPIEISSILKCLHCLKTDHGSSEWHIVAENITCGFRELARHGKVVFEYYHAKIKGAAINAGIENIVEHLDWSFEDWYRDIVVRRHPYHAILEDELDQEDELEMFELSTLQFE